MIATITLSEQTSLYKHLEEHKITCKELFPYAEINLAAQFLEKLDERATKKS